MFAVPLGMTGFRDFREIVAWQLARDLKLLAYQLLSRPEAAKDFGFRDQLSDAARSAPRNIAELNHFIDAVDSGYLSKEEFPQYEHAAKKALKAVNGLIRYLETTPDPPSKPRKKRRPPPEAP